ncbi:MAG: ion transporter [Spirochaetia bacterium]|nr:ion transporter [Spirochaetia bacterium]
MFKIGAFTKNLRKYVDGRAYTWFEYFILAVIFINVIILGLETLELSDSARNILHIIDQTCLMIFIIELIIKFIAFNKYFFKYGWNIFDLVIIVLSLIATLPCFTVFRIFRIFRSVRVVRVITSFRAIKAVKLISELRPLQKILRAMVLSFSGIIWTFFLLFIVYYVYSILGTNMFGPRFPKFFGNLGRSLLALFQIMTFDSWCSQIARPIITMYPWAWIYFVSFAFLSSFVIMNIIVGIVVNSVEETRREFMNKEAGISEVTMQDLSRQMAEMQRQISELNKRLMDKENEQKYT